MSNEAIASRLIAPGSVDRAEPLDDACPWQAKAGFRQHLGDDQFAVRGAGGVAFGHPVLGSCCGDRPGPPGRLRDPF